jgi:hypothetical protein
MRVSANSVATKKAFARINSAPAMRRIASSVGDMGLEPFGKDQNRMGEEKGLFDEMPSEMSQKP